MAGLPEVIGLLYRADWTRLSLSAGVRFEQDGDLARRRDKAVGAESMRRLGIRPDLVGSPSREQELDAERGGYHRWHAALLIAPGRRYRLDYAGDHGDQADGSDGEQAWTLRPPDAAPLAPRDFENGPGLPVPALFRPASLLTRFALDVGGPVTACGREAIAVTAVPRHGAVESGSSRRPPAGDRVELIVDAETTCSACSTAAASMTATSLRSAAPRCGGGTTRRRGWARCPARGARRGTAASAISSTR